MSDNKLPDKNAPKTPKATPKTVTPKPSGNAPKVAPKTAPKTAVTPKPTANSAIKSNSAKVKTPTVAKEPASTKINAGTTATPKTNPFTPKVNPVTKKVDSEPKPVMPNKSAIKPNPIKPQTKAVDASGVMVKADDNGEKKKKRRKLLLLLLLLLLFVTSIGLAVYFVSKNAPVPEIKFSIEVLSSEVKTEYVDENDHTVNKIQFMPGDPVEGNLKIKIINDKGTISTSENVFLRFKIDIVVDDNNYYNFFDPILNERYEGEKWTCGDKTLTDFTRGQSFDGYYYYNTKCYGGEEIEVFNSIDFVGERQNNALNGKEGKMIFTIEILQGDHSAINDNWQTAPTAWRRKVR